MPFANRRSWAAVALCGSLFGVTLYAQWHYLASRPQPQVMGDPGAYYEIARQWWQAAGDALFEGYPHRRRGFRNLARLSFFAIYGTVYGGVDALAERGPQGIFLYHGALGAGTGVLLFFAVFRLTGSLIGGLLAQLASLFYVTFIVTSGVVLPEPTIVFLESAALAAYAQGMTSLRRWLALSGFLLGISFLVRPQSAGYLLLLVGGLIVSVALLTRGTTRRGALAWGAGFLPAAVAWTGIVFLNRDVPSVLADRYGLYNFSPPYDLGFWLTLDTDGWVGPYGFHDNPYAKALEVAAARRPSIPGSWWERKLFTAEYVASRPVDSLRTVVVNLYRLLRLPDNMFRVDYLISYPAQVRLHQSVVFAALIFLPAAAVGSRHLLPVYVVPLFLCLLYPLYHVLTKYTVPMMPFLIAAGTSALVMTTRWIAAARREPRMLGVAIVSLAALGAALVSSPATAYALRVDALLVHLFRLGSATLFVAGILGFLARLTRARRRERLLFGATGAFLLLPFLTHELRYFQWHQLPIRLVGGDYQHVIELDSEDARMLGSWPEAFVLIDLEVLTGDVSDLDARIAGRPVTPRPTMPSYGASTWVGGRAGETVPQWWAIPLEAGFIEEDTIRVSLRWRGAPDEAPWISADLPSDVTRRTYHGPSFGDWAKVSGYKLRHDGDYRLMERLPLASLRARSLKDGQDLGAHLRIRVVALSADLGGVRWESAPLTERRPARLVFEARSGNGGDAEVRICDRRLRFPLSFDEEAEVSESGLHLSAARVDGEEAVAAFSLTLPPDCGKEHEALELDVRYLAGMKPAQRVTERFFEPRASSEIPAGAVQGFVQLIDRAPYRHWQPERVF